jgi:hypothetical protein
MWANKQARNWYLNPTNTLSRREPKLYPIRLKFLAQLALSVKKGGHVPEITFCFCALLSFR